MSQDPQDAQPADSAATQVQIDDSFESAAKASEASGDWLAAAGFWQSLLDRDPTNLEASLGLAENLRRVGQNDHALNVLRSALTHDPDDPELLGLYGRTLVQAGNATDAIEPLQRSIEQDGTVWETFAALGVAYGMLNEPERADEANLRALALAPGNPNVLNNMGLAAAIDGNLDGAIDLLERAAQSNEADVTVRQNLALLLAYRGDLTRAEQLARQDLPEDMADRNIAFYQSLSSDEVEQLEDLVNQSQMQIDEEPLAAPVQETAELALNDSDAPAASQVQVVVPDEEIFVPADEIIAAVATEDAAAENGEDTALAPVVLTPEPAQDAAPDEGAAVAPQAAIPEPEAQASDNSALAPQRINRDQVEPALPAAEGVGGSDTDEPPADAILEMMGSITAPSPEAGDVTGIEGDDQSWQRRSNNRSDELPSVSTFDPDVLEAALEPSGPIAVLGESEDGN